MKISTNFLQNSYNFIKIEFIETIFKFCMLSDYLPL